MTREELIKKQAEIYTDDVSNYTEWTDDGGWTDYNAAKFVEKAFIEGAKWADNNPKSHWISVEDDLPCNHKELMENEYKTKKVLAVMRSDKSSSKNIEICYMTNQYCSIGNWYWINTLKTHVTHWMPLPELPRNR